MTTGYDPADVIAFGGALVRCLIRGDQAGYAALLDSATTPELIQVSGSLSLLASLAMGHDRSPDDAERLLDDLLVAVGHVYGLDK